MAVRANTNEPTRPLTAFMFFSRDMRDKVKAENPDVSFGQIGTILANMWTTASLNTRVEYNTLEYRDKVRYQKEMEKYTGEKARKKQAYKEKKRHTRTTNKQPRGANKANAPKRPLTAYMYFVKDVIASMREQNPDISTARLSDLIAQRWQTTPDDAKAWYRTQEKEDKKRYDAQMQAYRAGSVPANTQNTSSSEED